MRILKLTFQFLTISGCWRPDSWSSLHKRLAYNVYTSIMVLILYTFMLSLFIDLIIMVGNFDDFTDTFFVLVDIINSCCKILILLINRKNIITLIDMLMKEPCRPSTSTEMNILYKFDKRMEINNWLFVCLNAGTLLYVLLSSLYTNFSNSRQLLWKAWLPFDYSSTLLFNLTYTYQLIGIIVQVIVGISCDTLICGLLAHICCQIEILTYRLRKIVSHSDVLRDCVHHHYHILRLASIVNEKFQLIIVIQFILTILILCFSLYQTSIATTTAKHIEMILYMACVFIEIFFYCWYGNELQIKLQNPKQHILLKHFHIYESYQMTDDIFEIEWPTLDKNGKTSLMIIMRRAIVPVQITCAYIIPMNLDSFLSILNLSYSTYNLLQSTRE